MGARLVRKTWHGDEFKARARRANGRFLLGAGEKVAVGMASHAHVQDNVLRPSIHVAVPDTMGEVPYITPIPTNHGAVEVGSWLPYACVENNRGGDHRFADLGWQEAQEDFDSQLARAWREEGL